MRYLLLAIGLLLTIYTNGQSNKARTIQLGFGFSISSSESSLETSIPDTKGNLISKNLDDKVSITNIGIKAQYGLSEPISIGIFIRRDLFFADYIELESFDFFHFDATTLCFGVEGKYYLVNNFNFNLTVNPSIGFSNGKAILSHLGLTNFSTSSISGLTYGIGSGFNWFFNNTMGIHFNANYVLNSLSGSLNDSSNNNIEYKFKSGGVLFDFGFTFKFN